MRVLLGDQVRGVGGVQRHASARRCRCTEDIFFFARLKRKTTVMIVKNPEGRDDDNDNEIHVGMTGKQQEEDCRAPSRDPEG